MSRRIPHHVIARNRARVEADWNWQRHNPALSGGN